jgi:hypothetical protein
MKKLSPEEKGEIAARLAPLDFDEDGNKTDWRYDLEQVAKFNAEVEAAIRAAEES